MKWKKYFKKYGENRKIPHPHRISKKDKNKFLEEVIKWIEFLDSEFRDENDTYHSNPLEDFIAWRSENKSPKNFFPTSFGYYKHYIKPNLENLMYTLSNNHKKGKKTSDDLAPLGEYELNGEQTLKNNEWYKKIEAEENYHMAMYYKSFEIDPEDYNDRFDP